MKARWIVLLSILAAAGCDSSSSNTSASQETASGAAFAGTYSGEGVTLRLTGTGAEHQGLLEVGGRLYDVKATAKGETLSGSFRAGEESFELEAKFVGDTLELLSGGKTHRLHKGDGKPSDPAEDRHAANPMGVPTSGETAIGNKAPASGETAVGKKAPAIEAPSPSDEKPVAVEAGFSGSFKGKVGETETSVRLTESGRMLGGVINSGGYKYHVMGKVTGKGATGTLHDPQNGGKNKFVARVDGDSLKITMTVPGASGFDMNFRRVGKGKAGASATPKAQAKAQGESGAARNPALVGTWSRTTSMGGGGASFSSKEFLRITADGRYQLGAGQAAAGGAGWSMGSDDSVEITDQGKWKTKGQNVLINEGGGWQSFARFYVEGSKLMLTLGDGSRQIWYRN